ncbi:lanthionine synthetase C family protein [Micromonospora globbae]|uniref:lanthionine synthetase C family protein n=1 Tax=Micromonospora globbae TaxID=1894969 RepID=UPI00341D03CD
MSAASYGPAFCAALADRLDAPATAQRWMPTGTDRASWTHSLSHGAAGIALLHAERARSGQADWATFHRWASLLATGLTSGHGMFAGAPAVAHVFATAADAQPDAFRSALATLDRQISRDLIARTRLAHARIDRRAPGDVAEWDLISGLAGLTRYLLRRAPGDPAIRDALACLVRVTQPIRQSDMILPGWWSDRDPHRGYAAEWSGGYGNFGLAHGAAAILALLALATLHGVEVPGQRDAITTLYDWYQFWQQPSPAGPWWPQYITINELHDGQLHNPAPGRPSWCYGTPGIARALQLGGHALGQLDPLHLADNAIRATLAPGTPAAPLTDLSVCHGCAGLLHTMRHLGQPTDSLIAALLARLDADPEAAAIHLLAMTGPGLMEGVTGIALVLHSYTTDPTLSSPWDTILLLH